MQTIHKFKFFHWGNRVRPLAIAVILLAAIFIATALVMRVTRVEEAETSKDWPQYRHDPAHTGYTRAKGPDDNHVLWEFEVEISEVWRSPAVVDGKVFIAEVGTATGSVTGRSYLYSLDASDGELIWKKEIGHLVSWPAVVNGVVYIGGGYDNQIHAFNAENGDEIWSYTLPDTALASPTVVGGRVYFTTYLELYCLDARDGGLIWKTGSGSGFQPVAVAGNRIYGGYLFVSLNAENGELIWVASGHRSYPWPMGHTGHAIPAVAHDKVYVTARSSEIAPYASVFDRLYALSAENGEEVWRYDAVIGGAPAVTEDKVLIMTDGDPAYMNVGVECLDATTGELVWKTDFKVGLSLLPPIAVGDKVYAGAGSKIYALSLETGEVLWSYLGYIPGGLAVADGKLFVGTHDGYVVAFGSPLNG